MNATTTHRRAPRGTLLIPLTTALLLSPDVWASGTDLVAGTISGTAGMNDSNSRGGQITLYGGSFSGSAPLATDGSFSMTVQSPVVYESMNTYQYGYEPNYFYISTNRGNLGIDLPEGGNVTVDLSTSSGTVVFSPVVSTLNGLPTGTITSSEIRFSRNWTQESGSMWGRATGTGSVQAPIPVGGEVRLYGDVTVSVFDADGVTSLCSAKITLPDYLFQVTAGNRTEVEVPIDIHPGLCETAIVGDVGSIGGNPIRTYLRSNGSANVTSNLTYGEGEDVLPYALEGLPPGNFYPSAYIYFDGGERLYDQSYEYGVTTLEAGQVLVRDFVTEAAFVDRTIAVTGPAADLLTQIRAEYSGQWLYDPETQTYGDNSGNFSANNADLTTGVVRNTLSDGVWEPRALVYFQGQTNGASFYNRVQINERDTSQFVTAVGGEVVDAGTKEISVSQGSVTFDVIEQPGEPVTTLSNPQLYINGTNSVTNEYVYIFHNYYIYNAETATASIVAPPGEYNFTAYAVVNGTRSRFNSGSLSIGVAVGTPTGNDVEVVPQDENGDPSPVAITFDEVTTGGETTASVTSVGPAAPDGYTLLEIVDESQFLNLTSSAAFTSAEICVSYDMDVLGIEAGDESRLVLQVYTCDEENNCTWTVLADGYVDEANDSLCGTTSSLGTFGITLPDQPAVTGSCIGTIEASAQVGTDAGVCTATGTGENEAFGSCSEDGLASCLFDGSESLQLGLGETVVTVSAVANDGSSDTCESYVNIVDDEAPSITCASNQTLECASNTNTSMVSASCEDNCGDCSTSCGTDTLALGTTTVSCVASDADGSTRSCATSVTVVDTTAPQLSMEATPTLLWPPNHKLVPIAISAVSSDTCDDSPEVTCRVTSNEADEGLGDGDFSGDIVWQDGNLLLRAERSGLGNDRVYTIVCDATDASGNVASSTQTVVVPHDFGGDDTEVVPGNGKPANKVKGKK